MNFLIQNPHLTQSDPRKIDPHICTPDPSLYRPQRKPLRPRQTLSTSSLLITVLTI